jgi:hypothetical protein
MRRATNLSNLELVEVGAGKYELWFTSEKGSFYYDLSSNTRQHSDYPKKMAWAEEQLSNAERTSNVPQT